MKKILFIFCVLLYSFFVNSTLSLSLFLSFFVTYFLTSILLTKYSNDKTTELIKGFEKEKHELTRVNDILIFDFILFLALSVMFFEFFSKF